jgi:signal transduction histidine kinase
MNRFFAPYLNRLNSAYRDRSYFVGLKARLLASISVLALGFVVFNIVKTVWLQLPVLHERIALNILVGIAGMVCLRSLLKGKLELAGNWLALATVLAIHGALIVGCATATPLEPLSVGFQLFAFDLVLLLISILFASRRVATVVFGIMAAGQVGYYVFMLRVANLAPTVQFAADALLREGLIAMSLLYCVGITMILMVEAAHRRSEESLRHSQEMNDNLERLEHETRILSERRRQFLDMQRDFISLVSHEFRTPLTSIQGAQYLLEELLRKPAGLSGAVAEKAEKWLGLQASGLKTMNNLVDQVLVLNRIEHMTSEASLSPLPPGEMLTAAVARFNVSTSSPRVILRDDVPPGFTASMDPELVKAAAENLISNALKYSGPEQLVQVRVYTEQDGWVIEVVDQGKGIPHVDQASVFHPFFRAGNVGTIPGTGLGLAMVRRAVDYHGGQIEFESKENEGTRFKLHFPTVARPPLDLAALSRLPLVHRS